MTLQFYAMFSSTMINIMEHLLSQSSSNDRFLIFNI